MPSPPRTRRLHRVLAVLAGALLLVAPGCQSDVPEEDYAARVGSYTLTTAELDSALKGFAGLQDTSEARQQIIEQWVTRTLLLREALRTNLDESPAVKERLAERRRSVLVTALTNRMYEQAEVEPSASEIRDYFARNREQFVLREPYVRVRHLTTPRETAADSARQALLSADPVSDSLWAAVATQYAASPNRARSVAERYFSESRFAGRLPYVADELAELEPGEVSPVVRDDSLYHVLHLVDRADEGSEPQLEWVEPQIRRRLRARARKQMYAREVQRLRNQAKAQNELDIR